MLENKSVKQIISLIHKKEISVSEVVSFYIDRIKKYNPSLNAIVSIKDEEQIINEAKYKDENFDDSKPLFGLPLASKDLLDVVDFPTTYGFPGYKDYFPKKNSLIVDRQLDAGGIMIGKTNTAELGVGVHIQQIDYLELLQIFMAILNHQEDRVVEPEWLLRLSYYHLQMEQI